MRRQHGCNNSLVIGHVARMSKIKNQIFLLEIFEKNLLIKPEAILILIGDGELKEELMDYSIELKINDHIKFLGSRKNVHEYMQAFDVFVLPSLSEGFGNVLIESQAAGLPTIVSKEGVPQEVAVTNLVSFISLASTPEVWATQIIDKASQTIRKSTAVKLSNKGFDMKSFGQEFQTIYRNLNNE